MNVPMKDRIEAQITERAPWLAAGGPMIGLLRLGLDRVLGYGRTVALAEEMEHWSGPEVMQRMGTLLARRVEVRGLDAVPRHGPALIVANHPTGIADGIILHHLVAPLRPDLFFYANSDITRVMPQLESLIVPVEWRVDKRSLRKTRTTMALTRAAIEAGRLGVIFPSGRLAQRRGLRLYERPWMSSAAMIARKFDLPVIPVNIRARNSALFYTFDRIHPSLRDITLFHETLNKARQSYAVTVGEPISPAALPASSDEGIALLQRAVLGLGGQRQGLSLIGSRGHPA